MNQTNQHNTESDSMDQKSDWKPVGPPRRASEAVIQNNGGYFSQKMALSQTTRNKTRVNLGGLQDVAEVMDDEMPEDSTEELTLPSYMDSNGSLKPEEEEETPVFGYYGGRFHGTRSFSLVPGAAANPPGFTTPTRKPSLVGARRPSLLAHVATMNVFQGTAVGDNPTRNRSRSMSYNPGPVIGQNGIWSSINDSELPSPGTGRRRSFSIGNNQDNQVAEHYFAPHSTERYLKLKILLIISRRRSLASSAIEQTISGMKAIGVSETKALPKDFAEQYGNFFDSSSKDQSDVIPSVEARVSSPVKPVQSTQSEGALLKKPIFVVEFKGGRNDFFYIDENTKLANGATIKEGDLVIVEADRGDDLGKVIIANMTDPSSISGVHSGLDLDSLASLLAEGTIQPKSIYRLARQNEVSLLLDKARDESKALTVIQAKIRQKELPMEVIDAEYQWDRKRLTYYYVSEQRIDFRDLVRELFKIFKTRIWMCAVERNHSGLNMLRQTK